MACLKDSTLQGYLGEFAQAPLGLIVESHLATCARCRNAFDRVVATNRRVNSWLAKLSSPAHTVGTDVTVALAQVLNRVGPNDQLFTPIQGRGTNPRTFAWSLIFQGAVVAVLMLIGTAQVVRTPPATTMTLIAPPPPPRPIRETSHAGGGGQHSPLPPLRGELPKPAPNVYTPPLVTIDHPVVTLDASLIAPPDAWAVPTSALGDPLGTVGGGSGPGRRGGIGVGDGPGFGPGNGPGTDGDLGVFAVGNGTTRPVLISHADPEYSDEARKAKYSGTVILSIIVNTDGTAGGIKVVKSLGMGLDEKAIEAVQKWRFRPGMNKGAPVRVRAQVEVNFRLL